MPLHYTHRLVRPNSMRARWQIRPVKRHKCRAPMPNSHPFASSPLATSPGAHGAKIASGIP